MAAPENAQEELEKYGDTEVPLPRIAIKFCVQCKWNLRAAYYAQELLSTFSTALGEVSLIPATGGTFTITLLHRPSHLPPPTTSSGQPDLSTSLSPSSFPDARYLPRPPVAEIVLWDRKVDNGFPETKELKTRVRNVIDPGRDLGHVDRSLRKAAAALKAPEAMSSMQSSAGFSPSSTVEGGAVMADISTGPTIPVLADKCEDC